MNSVLLCIVVLAGPLLAQELIPPGTILPAQTNSSLDSRKVKAGQPFATRLMQEVLLPAGKIPAGAKILGHVVGVEALPGAGSRLRLQFDAVRFDKHELTVNTHLRALASMAEVHEAQVPATATDRGTPWAWMTTNQIGGEVAYGQGGPVTRGEEVVGQKISGGGVRAKPRATVGTTCPQNSGNDLPQSMWVFSSDACGLYGYPNLAVAHYGRTAPLGQIVLESTQGPIKLSGGSGMLLIVTN
jgi:hypothetical protein